MENSQTPMILTVNRIIQHPELAKEIIKKSGYTSYILSCQMRVMLLNDSKTDEMAKDFGLTKWDISSYYCNNVEKLILT